MVKAKVAARLLRAQGKTLKEIAEYLTKAHGVQFEVEKVDNRVTIVMHPKTPPYKPVNVYREYSRYAN